MTARRSAILTYHSLDDSGSVISMPPDLFRRQMEFLATSGIPVVPLDQVLSRPGSVAITFDDGFRNLLEHAIPELERHNFPAAIFLVSGYCGRNNDWPGQSYDKAAQLPLMSWDEIASLPPQISLGAHTITHPDLTRISADECERELRGSKEQIEQRLGRPVRWLAYPYGASSPKVRVAARQQFELAVGTSLRFTPAQPDLMDLPRIDTFYLRGSFSIESLFTAPGNVYIGIRHQIRRIRKLAPI
jgi:peptidoglycan/xylan/chitin deacetylase (PgdA/CDA1 family)